MKMVSFIGFGHWHVYKTYAKTVSVIVFIYLNLSPAYSKNQNTDAMSPPQYINKFSINATYIDIEPLFQPLSGETNYPMRDIK